MLDDAQLLRSYTEHHSNPAFAQLVERHLPLIYSAALRQVGDNRQFAEDVAQQVFALLANGRTRGLKRRACS